MYMRVCVCAMAKSARSCRTLDYVLVVLASDVCAFGISLGFIFRREFFLRRLDEGFPPNATDFMLPIFCSVSYFCCSLFCFGSCCVFLLLLSVPAAAKLPTSIIVWDRLCGIVLLSVSLPGIVPP